MTAEPPGRRYVILEHDHPFRHWDFMLEAGEVLRTWRLAAPPQPGGTVAVTALGDHRRLYLEYEGPVSGNRGRVERWDAGVYTLRADEPGRLVVDLAGGRVRGTATLVQTGPEDWSLRLDP